MHDAEHLLYADDNVNLNLQCQNEIGLEFKFIMQLRKTNALNFH